MGNKFFYSVVLVSMVKHMLTNVVGWKSVTFTRVPASVASCCQTCLFTFAKHVCVFFKSYATIKYLRPVDYDLSYFHRYVDQCAYVVFYSKWCSRSGWCSLVWYWCQLCLFIESLLIWGNYLQLTDGTQPLTHFVTVTTFTVHKISGDPVCVVFIADRVWAFRPLECSRDILLLRILQTLHVFNKCGQRLLLETLPTSHCRMCALWRIVVRVFIDHTNVFK